MPSTGTSWASAASGSRRCGFPTTWTSPPCSTASTSGSPRTPSSSVPGCSTGSWPAHSSALDEVRRPLSDDLAPQDHPTRAVVTDAQPVQLPATVLGPVDEEPGDDVAGEVAGEGEFLELVLHTWVQG